MKDFILNVLVEVHNGYSLCGVVDRRALFIRLVPIRRSSALYLRLLHAKLS